MVRLPGKSPLSFGVAVGGSINNDGNFDIVISNTDGGAPNELVLNHGNNTFFDVRKLPGSEDHDVSVSIGLVDLDEDGFLGIVIANGFACEREETQTLWNNGDSTFGLEQLPGGR